MTLEEILVGESKNIEFKKILPEKSIKYMKTIVAFANGQGGKLVIGVEDTTRKVVGIDKDTAFDVMDSIANAISDSCSPTIVPDIYMQTISGETVIVVDIAPGRPRPYYIVSEGLQHGVYIRVAGTTRLSDEVMMKELLFEGNNRFFDKTVCLGLQASESDIENLCQQMKQVALRNCNNNDEKALVKNLTSNQLLSWGVLTEYEGKLVPTNAYAILTGADVLHCTFQCAVFKDNERIIFVDRREFTGPVQDIIEDAYQFVLRNIHLGAVIEGLYRQDVYEIPPSAIRELIINAAVHRSYLDNGNIQVAIFDDRLELTSPGKLPVGQTIAKMCKGFSKVRNEALAMAFSYMHLIERWGTGMLRIAKMIREAGLGELEVLGGETELRFNIYRKQMIAQSIELRQTAGLGQNFGQTAELEQNTGQTAGQTAELEQNAGQTAGQNAELEQIAGQNFGQTAELEQNAGQTAGQNAELFLNDDEKLVINLLKENEFFTTRDIAESLNWSKSKAASCIRKLRINNTIERIGSNRKGQWKVII